MRNDRQNLVFLLHKFKYHTKFRDYTYRYVHSINLPLLHISFVTSIIIGSSAVTLGVLFSLIDISNVFFILILFQLHNKLIIFNMERYCTRPHYISTRRMRRLRSPSNMGFQYNTGSYNILPDCTII